MTCRRKPPLLTTLLLILLAPGILADRADKEVIQPNLVLVTLDGVRWQEVFSGVDLALINHADATRNADLLKRDYWHDQAAERRAILFPFLWSKVATEGVLIGDRTRKSMMEVTNSWWFSYPGYNEILTGRADPDIDSNEKVWNPNRTFLEVVNELKPFANRVVAFGSWDVFPYIINSRRSGVPVNAGFSIAKQANTQRTRWLNEVSAESPRLWSSVRLDYITHGYAMETFKSQHPRVTYIAYGETDDFAHDGSYDRYIGAANRSDLMLSKLWSWLQSDPFYRGNTTLIITTDHGRGMTPETWRHHLSQSAAEKSGILDRAPNGVIGSDQIWFAAIGPRIKAKGSIGGHWTQSQIAATALSSLQLDPGVLLPGAGEVMHEIFK